MAPYRRWWQVLWACLLLFVAGAGMLLAQQRPAPQFRDITAQLGVHPPPRLPPSGLALLTETFGRQVLPFDFDDDGDQDLLVLYGPHVADSLFTGLNRLFRNDGSQWVDVTVETGLDTAPPAGNAAVGDVDGDGYLDLYLCLYGSDRLLMNRGGRRWEDATAQAGIHNPHWATAAALLDANHDGWLDIYVANFVDYSAGEAIICYEQDTQTPVTCDPDLFEAAPNRLFINQGRGVFREATAAAGLADTTSRSLGVTLVDANSDGVLDLFVRSYRSANLLYTGDGQGRFSETALVSGLAYGYAGADPHWTSIAPFDANGDGATDLLYTTRAARVGLLLNDGQGHFFSGGYRSNLFQPRFPYEATAALLLDLDHSGTLDLLLTFPGQVVPDSLPAIERSARGRRIAWSDSVYRFYPAPIGPAAPLVLDTMVVARRLPRSKPAKWTLTAEQQDSLFQAMLLSEQVSMDSLRRFLSGTREVAEDTAAGVYQPIDPPGAPVLSRADEWQAAVQAWIEALRRASTGLVFSPATLLAAFPADTTIQIRTEPRTFLAADLNADGLSEIVASYPGGWVRIWELVGSSTPPFIDLQLRRPPGVGVIVGARLVVRADARVWRHTVTGPEPARFYLPSGEHEVAVEVTWPSGGVGTYRLIEINRTHVLMSLPKGE